MVEALGKKLNSPSTAGLKELGQETWVQWPFRTRAIYYKGRHKIEGGVICDGLTGVETRVEKTGIIPLVIFDVRDTRRSYLGSTVSKNGHLGLSLAELCHSEGKDGLRSGPHIKIKPHTIP